MTDLSHVDDSGEVHMVDVGAKPPMRRRAVARARVRMAAATAGALRALPKGDALVTAQVAGIMAAKRTAELIPLCHPLPLTHVGVHLDVVEGAVEIEASAETTASLTVYDMAKAIDKGMTIDEVQLVEKTKEAV
jgi:cyclic pyranopterin monophosphate synthase